MTNNSMPVREQINLWVKRFFFPGLDLHTRCRYRFISKFLRAGQIATLDAGCGNGALSYAAYARENRVLGVTMEPSQVEKARKYFSYIGTDPDRLRFEICNLYDLPKLGLMFDQIICSETLEHIARDEEVVQFFYDMLPVGGVLHVCCPYSEHPRNKGHVCLDESVGWHVRDGYTLETYRQLLEPTGFRIVRSVGLGSPLLVRLASMIQGLLNWKGAAAAMPLFLLTWPLQFLDYMNPAVPLSLYVECIKEPVKPQAGGN